MIINGLFSFEARYTYSVFKDKISFIFHSNQITDCAIFIVSIAKLKICFKTGKQTTLKGKHISEKTMFGNC